MSISFAFQMPFLLILFFVVNIIVVVVVVVVVVVSINFDVFQELQSLIKGRQASGIVLTISFLYAFLFLFS